MRTFRGWLAATLALGCVALQAGELGDLAPQLQVSKWVKGTEVDVTVADGKQVFVVEFWATWCGPCIQSIPHLTEMQKAFGERGVTFIGVSDEPPATVEPFVKEMGEKMDYNVVVDPSRKTHDGYMGAFGIGGIPHAFIVDQQGRIIWHDHPMNDLEEVLELVLAGDFSVEDARALQAERAAAADEEQQIWQDTESYFELAARADGAEQAQELGASIIERAGQNWALLNSFAWDILTRPGLTNRDLNVALDAAKTADALTENENAFVLDTLALAMFETGNVNEAVELQRKAVKLASTQGDPDLVAELELRLRRFEKKAQGGRQ